MLWFFCWLSWVWMDCWMDNSVWLLKVDLFWRFLRVFWGVILVSFFIFVCFGVDIWMILLIVDWLMYLLSFLFLMMMLYFFSVILCFCCFGSIWNGWDELILFLLIYFVVDEYVMCNGCKSFDIIFFKENWLFFFCCE